MTGRVDAPVVAEQTARSLIHNIWSIYRRGFVPIVLTYVVPVFPVLAVVFLTPQGSWQAILIYFLFALMYVALGALTITVGDICLGNAPNVGRSFSQVLRQRLWLKLIGLGLLITLLPFLGLVIVFVGYIWVFVRLIISPPILVLEGRSVLGSIRRSWQLTRGQFWRLFGLFLLVLLWAFIISLIPTVLASLLSGVSYNSGVALFYLLIVGWYGPVLGIAGVLLYYDQRVRREGYDADALTEDMMR